MINTTPQLFIYLLLFADHLDVVANRISDESAVIGWAILRAGSGLAIVLATRCDGLVMELVNNLLIYNCH